MTFGRWTKKKTEDNANLWAENSSGEKPGQKMGGGLRGSGPGLRTQGRGRCRTGEPGEGGGAEGWAGVRLEPGGGLTSWGPGE